MACSLVEAIGRIKRNVAECLSAESIEAACRAAKHSWRERELNPSKVVWAFLTQVLHGNTACEHVVRLARLSCSATAYCRARGRLPLALFERLLEDTTRAARRTCHLPLWRGHRTFWVDGSAVSMADTPALQEHFGQPGGQQPGCGFPVARLWGMFNARSGLLIKLLVAPLCTHDGSQVPQLHPELRAGDVVVADRAFASYAHLALLSGRNLHAVFRAHQRQLVSFRRDRRLTGKQAKGTVALYAASRLIRKLGKHDQLVEYTKPTTRPKWMSEAEFAALPATLIVRELRFHTKVKGCRTRAITLVTTLLDSQRYPAKALAELYRTRWGIETNFAHLKTTMRMDVLNCRARRRRYKKKKKKYPNAAVVARHQDHVGLQRQQPRHLGVERLDHLGLLRLVAVLARGVRPLHVQEEEVVRPLPRALERVHLLGDRAGRADARGEVHPEQPRDTAVGGVGRHRARGEARHLFFKVASGGRPEKPRSITPLAFSRFASTSRASVTKRFAIRALFSAAASSAFARSGATPVTCGSVSATRSPRPGPRNTTEKRYWRPGFTWTATSSILAIFFASASASGRDSSVGMRPARRSASRPRRRACRSSRARTRRPDGPRRPRRAFRAARGPPPRPAGRARRSKGGRVRCPG